MNAYQERQDAGIHWSNLASAQSYQYVQPVPRWPAAQHQAEAIGLEKQMADFCTQNEAVLREVKKFYAPMDSSVQAFLAGHRTLPGILLEAMPAMRCCFGSSAVVNLRVPIDDAGARTMYAVVMWPGKLKEAREALAKFDDEWWMARARQTGGLLVFTYELV